MLNTESAIIPAAIIWYKICILGGKLKMSSKVAPIIRMESETIIGIVKLSNLKKKTIAIRAGIVIASPPNDGVMPL